MAVQPLLLVDMDGVLCAYNERLLDSGLVRPNQLTHEKWQDSDLPPELKEEIRRLVYSRGFFAELKPIHGAVESVSELMALGWNVYVCSQPPKSRFAWLREAAAGDPKASRQRLEALSTLTVLRRTRAVDELTEAFLSAGALPAKAKADATYLAVATSHRVDYLLTWNMKHLANALILRRLRPVAEQHGHSLPVVCTPLQLMGEIEYEG